MTKHIATFNNFNEAYLWYLLPNIGEHLKLQTIVLVFDVVEFEYDTPRVMY